MKDKPSLMPLVVGALLMTLVFATVAEANLGTNTLDKFVGRTTGWWAILRDYALYIFKITATLEVCLFGIRMVMQRSQLHEIVGQFALVLLFICFIAAVINNYEKWSLGIAIEGLKPAVAKLSGGGTAADAGSPIAMIFGCLEAMVPVLGDAGIRDIGMVMVYVFCMGAIIAVFAIICCRYIIVICEFHIVANAGIILIGLGGSKVFKDYAINVMKYILSVAIKLFVFQLILNIGFSILSLSDIESLQGQSIKNIDLYSLIIIIVQSAILLGLASTLPQTCAGILNGASVDGGNPLRMAAGAVATQGLAMAAKAGQSAVSTMQNLRTANQIATAQGVSGIGGRIQSIRQTMQSAGMAANPTSVKTQLSSQLNATKAMSMVDGVGPAASAAAGAAAAGVAPISAATAPMTSASVPMPSGMTAATSPGNGSATAPSAAGPGNGSAASSSMPLTAGASPLNTAAAIASAATGSAASPGPGPATSSSMPLTAGASPLNTAAAIASAATGANRTAKPRGTVDMTKPPKFN